MGSFAGSFGQAISVQGPGNGFPGKIARGGERVIASRTVKPTAALNLYFGQGAVEISNTIGGYWDSFQDFLATASNAQYLQQQFAGVAIQEVTTQPQYLTLNQSAGTTVATATATASVSTNSLTVASVVGTIAVGQYVEGAGVPPNTYVTAVSGSTITISNNVFAALSTTAVSFTTGISSNTGYYGAGQLADVLERGSINVVIAYGTPQANLPVYIRTVANASLGGTAVGDFEAAADLATSSITIAATTLGSPNVTTSGATGLAVGQMIVSPLFPANTYIVSGATTSWVFSQNALVTVSTATVAMSAYNTAILGTTVDPWLVFRTGAADPSGNNVYEITIKNRHAA